MGLKINIPGENTYNILDLDAYVMMVAFDPKVETEKDAIYAIDVMLERSRETIPAAHELGYLTAPDKSNYRYAVAKTPVIIKCTKDGYFGGDKFYKKGEERIYQGYKANRSNLEKPLYFNRLREYACDTQGAILVRYIEVDDRLGREATKPGRKATIHTHDKDLNMVEVDIFNVRNRTLHKYTGPKLERLENGKVYGRGLPWFYCQMLTGDSGDNIPGIPKYGPVNAWKVLRDCHSDHEMFDVVWGIYNEYILDEYTPYKSSSEDAYFDAKARFLEIAQLLWMQTNDIRCIKDYLEKQHEFD